MRRPVPNIALLFLSLLFADGLAAQSGTRARHGRQSSQGGPAIVVKSSVDKNQIIIGQPFHLLLEATVPGAAGTPLTWPVLDSLPHFEILERGGIDSASHPDGQYYKQYLTITSFDSGTYAVPQLRYISGPYQYLSDSVPIQIGYSKFDPNADFHDIKDIIDIPNPYAKWIPYIVAFTTLLAIGLVVWLIRKKKLLQKLAPELLKPRLSPYDEAVHDLDELEKKGITGEGAVKVYYTRLNEILRRFLWRRLAISSVAETNEELIQEIRRLPLTAAQFDALAEMLRMTDFVKFAKYQPGSTENEQNLRLTRDSVDRLNMIAAEKETAKT